MKQPCVWKPNPYSQIIHNVVNEITGNVLGHVHTSKELVKDGKRYFRAISYEVQLASGEWVGYSGGKVFYTPEDAMEYIAETSKVK